MIVVILLIGIMVDKLLGVAEGMIGHRWTLGAGRLTKGATRSGPSPSVRYGRLAAALRDSARCSARCRFRQPVEQNLRSARRPIMSRPMDWRADRIGSGSGSLMSHDEFVSRAQCSFGQRRSTKLDLTISSSIWAFALLTAVLISACSGGQRESNSDPYHLMLAKFQDCKQQGDTMAHYLDTGQPAIYNSFGWAEQHRAAQSLTGKARIQYIRDQADAVIQLCDTNDAQRLKSPSPGAEDTQGTLEAKEQNICNQIAGATWSWGVCYVRYLSPNDGNLYYYPVSFDATGSVVPGPGPRNAAECATYGGNIAMQWHEDTDICSS